MLSTTQKQTDFDYENLSTILDQQAWIVVENSSLSPEEIERLHNDAVTIARGSTYFADCIQKVFLDSRTALQGAGL